MKNHRVALTALSFALLLGIVASAEEKPLSNVDVVNLAKLGLGDTVVIAKIRQAPSVKFDLETEALGRLKSAGVSGAVIAAMLERATADRSGGGDSSGGGGVEEPEFVGTVYRLDRATGTLVDLERQTASSSVEVRGLGWGGAEGYLQVKGERSSVRLNPASPIEFVVRLASQQSDPQSLVHLVPLEPADGYRRLSVGKASLFGGSKAGVSDYEIPLRASRYGKSSFVIAAAQPLAPGEYAFAGQTEGEAFCFAVEGDPGASVGTQERRVPFRVGEQIHLGIVERGVRIDSVEIGGWPKPKALEKAQQEPDRMTDLSVVFLYTNRSTRDYKCRYSVAVLDKDGQELGSGEREAHVEAEEEDDTNRVTVRIRTLDFPKASTLRVQTAMRLE